jgi:hypothetical protein
MVPRRTYCFSIHRLCVHEFTRLSPFNPWSVLSDVIETLSHHEFLSSVHVRAGTSSIGIYVQVIALQDE